MFHKKSCVNLVGSALLTFCVSVAFAAKTDDHQHQSGQHEGHGKTSSDHTAHQCDHMLAVDANKDGKISKEEFMKHHEQMFDKKDVNKDGFVDKEEMHRMMEKKHQHESGDHQKSSDHSHDNVKK